MKLLTVFTPAYNRKHTIGRTFESLLSQTCKNFQWLIIDDGSGDGTKDWIQTLGKGNWVVGPGYDWMGRRLPVEEEHYIVDVPFADGVGMLHIEYIYKSNGGLYTGYNVAYDIIQSELCVCIDSDDYAPEDLVEKVSIRWDNRDKSKNYCGIVGLDFNVVDKQPIGGAFQIGVTDGFYSDIKRGGDTKEVMRVDLMKVVSPMIGFEGEKDFNPFYMVSQVVDKYPILVENSNFCWVEYQIGADSMSQAIFKQFKRSPKSYAKYRLNEMKLNRYSDWKSQMRLHSHYISACIFSNDKEWLRNSPRKWLTILCLPLAIMLNIYIRNKAR